MPDEREVGTKILSCLLDTMLWVGLIVEKAEFERGFSLWLVHLRLLVAQIKYLHQVFDGLACIVSLRIGLCE